MKLRTAHIILMSAALGLGAILVAYGVNRFAGHDDGGGLGLAAGGAAVTAGVAAYLRNFIRKG